MNITSVGYFREMPDGTPSDPTIKDYIDKGNDSIIDKVCTYLNSGIPLIVSPGKNLLQEIIILQFYIITHMMSALAKTKSGHLVERTHDY